jgi:hypothetical protein
MAITADKGFLVYDADKKAPSLDEAGSRYLQVRAQLASTYAKSESFAILTEVMEKELKRTDLTPKKDVP